MYTQFMKLIELNTEDIAQNLLKEFRKKGEFLNYREISEDVFLERISQVIRNVYLRLGSWLDKNKQKNTLFVYYSNLGAERFREGIPLDEVIQLFITIKMEIWHLFREQMVPSSEIDMKRLMEIDFYVNLFFDRIVTAIVKGYQNELMKSCERSGVKMQGTMTSGKNDKPSIDTADYIERFLKQ